MNLCTRLRLVGLTTTVVGLALPMAVMAAKAPDTAVFVNPHLTGQASGPSKTYTQAEIRDAKPLAWTLHATTGNTRALPQAMPATIAPVMTVESGLPDPNADREAQRDFADQWALLEQAQPLTAVETTEAHSLATPFSVVPGPLEASKHPYTSYLGNYWKEIQTRFPWKAVGKLMFKDGNTVYTGTANVIYGPQGNLIVTAAHNVFSAGGQHFYKDFVFIPAERDGVQPYGQFPFKTVRVLLRYRDAGDNPSSRDDVAVLTLQNNQAGKPVSYYTGWLGLKMNLPYTLNATAMGYSEGGGAKSKWTTITTGQTFFFDGKDCPTLKGGEDILFMGSNLVAGASGGAWLYQYKPFDTSAQGNYVTSVVSGGINCADYPNPVPSILLGPRFSEANIGVLCTYEGCKPETKP